MASKTITLEGLDGAAVNLESTVEGWVDSRAIVRVCAGAASRELTRQDRPAEDRNVAPQHTVLTTGRAADLLGVSRPTLVRLLEAGEIPFNKPGRHRRIRLGDLLAYQQRARRARAVGLDEMVRVSEQAGIYDLPRDAAVNAYERIPSFCARGDGDPAADAAG